MKSEPCFANSAEHEGLQQLPLEIWVKEHKNETQEEGFNLEILSHLYPNVEIKKLTFPTPALEAKFHYSVKSLL